MNWQVIDYDWNHVRAFLATAKTGSLSAAARELRTSQPTIGRQIAALEEVLGVILFERGRRGLTVTAVGRQLLQHADAMATAAHWMSLTASGQSQDIAGEVSVTAVDFICSQVVVPVIRRLALEAPALSIRMLSSNAIQDLARRDADIAIRHVRPDQPDLVAKLVTTYHASFYAARSFLDRQGRPRTAEELKSIPIIGNDEPEPFIRIAAEHGISICEDQFRHPANSATLIWDLVRAGLGMAFLPDEFCRDMPDLERVFPDHAPFGFPVWLVTHRELQTSRRIRMVYDALAQELAARR